MTASRNTRETLGVRGPDFRAIDGQLWRHADPTGWWPMDDATAGRLWAAYALVAGNPADWFHTRAADLANGLQHAIQQATEQRNERKAA